MVEIKVAKAIGLHHIKQVVTYLKVANLPLGLILNFGAPSMKYGIKRIINAPRTQESGLALKPLRPAYQKRYRSK